MGRGGSSSGRSPNDDRSDVKNPNNAAYDHDQANRFGEDEDWCAYGEATGRSEYDRRADRFTDRVQRNESRRQLARRDLKEAERRYGEESLPYDIAREEHQEAERRWDAMRDGQKAYEDAVSLWEVARIQQLCRAPGEPPLSPAFWGFHGVTDEECARVAALDSSAYALVEHRGETAAAWAAYEKARDLDCRASAKRAVEAARKEWMRAQAAWKRAQEANRPAREALELARERAFGEREACSAEGQAIGGSRRSF